MTEDKTNLFGKTYNTVGSTDSNFIIKTKGDLKVQWGNKYIDILKNGKIASSSEGFIYEYNSIDEIKKDGLYLINDQVVIRCNNKNIELNNFENTYISYLQPQELTTEQKQITLKNIGLYYDTLEEAKQAGLNNGMVFILSENKIFFIKDGILSEYKISENATAVQKIESTGIENIVVSDDMITININSTPAMAITLESVTISQTLNVSEIKSSNFSITSHLDKSILDIDTINWKDIEDSSKIGVLNEESIAELKTCPEIIKVPNSGIYSSNFIGLNSKLYDPVFKTRCTYPKYDESILIPEIENLDKEEFNTIVPNLKWIKELINIIVPKGTIVMWNGKDIPKGWAICDGTNGTPNLIGKFIKADTEAGIIGGNNTITLSESNLPNHIHTIAELNTSENESNTHNHVVDGQTVTSTNTSITDTSYTWKTVPSQEEFEKMSDIPTVKAINLKSLTVGDKYLDNLSLSSEHSHSVNIASATSENNNEDTHKHVIGQHSTSETNNASGTAFDIQPEYYSLIFIIKI